MESVKQVEDQAAAWLVRRDAGHWTQAEQDALDAWLESSTANMVAFLRLETAWRRTHRLKSLSAGVPSGVVPSLEQWQFSPIFKAAKRSSAHRENVRTGRFNPRGWVLAASVLIAVAIGAWTLSPAGTAYYTPVGGIATVPTADGSKIILNTDSEVRIDIGEAVRHVQLEHGEAFFQVAKDPRRPFVVSVGGKRVIAVGTAFSVYRNKDDIRVVVTEGKVRIEKADRNDILLAAGGVARSHRGELTLKQKPVPQVEEDLSWRSGFLTFRDTALAEAIIEFNRYNARKILIEDPSIAGIRFSGKFQSTQYEAFIRLLEDSFNVHAENADGNIRLTTR